MTCWGCSVVNAQTNATTHPITVQPNNRFNAAMAPWFRLSRATKVGTKYIANPIATKIIAPIPSIIFRQNYAAQECQLSVIGRTGQCFTSPRKKLLLWCPAIMLSAYGKFSGSFHQSHREEDFRIALPTVPKFGLGSAARRLSFPPIYKNRNLRECQLFPTLSSTGVQCLRQHAIRQRIGLRRRIQEGHLDGHQTDKGRGNPDTGGGY